MLLDAEQCIDDHNYRQGYRDGKIEAYALGVTTLANPDATDCYSQGYRAGFAAAHKEIKECGKEARRWSV